MVSSVVLVDEEAQPLLFREKERKMNGENLISERLLLKSVSM